MHKIMCQFPRESIIYMGDTAHLPYGEKEPDTIVRCSLQCSQFLLQQNIKLLIVACSTATAYSLEILKKQLPIPVIGVIEPTAREAVCTTRNQRLAVLGTTATIDSQVYTSHIKTLLPKAEVFSVACPEFVPLIENGYSSQPIAQLAVQKYLKDFHVKKIDTLVLGCTHYLFLSDFIQQEMGPQVFLINSATSCVFQVDRILKKF
ncbi:MAG TPA: glutamate racemase, partial [Coxiellaceae bacterium]|nr:glutamate racemase [Coxiellaceae bacterium]